MNRIFSLVMISIWFLIPDVSGQDHYFPEPMQPKRLVNDFAGVMSSSEISSLENKLLDYNHTTSIEIAIVTVDTLYGYDVSDYAFKLGEKWGIGKADKDNGVLILASIRDRKMFIATGYGMEGVLPDAIASQIYRNEMVPEFRSGDYYQGFSRAADAIVAVSKNEYKADPSKAPSSKGGTIKSILFFLLIFFILFIIIIRKGGKGGGGTYVSRRGADIITGSILGGLLRGGSSGGSWGGGGGWGSGGGGFGGFGGGSFGGGGAGGSW